MAPYATALAVMIDPARSAKNLLRLAAEGILRRLRIRRVRLTTPIARGGRIRAPHCSVISRLSRITRHVARRPRQCPPRRSHGRPVPCGSARAGDRAAAAGARAAPASGHRAAAGRRDARRRPAPPCRRRYRTPHTSIPHSQFLSNGNYVRRSPTPAAAPASARPGGDAVAPRRDPRPRQPVHLPARHAQRRYVVADLPPGAARAGRVRRRLSRPRGDVPIARDDDIVDPARDRRVARRRRRSAAAAPVNHGTACAKSSDQLRGDRPRADPTTIAHPAFGKLFVETEYLPESAALICHRRPRAADATGARGPCTCSASMAARMAPSSGKPIARSSWVGVATLGSTARTRWPAALRHHRLRPRSDLQLAPARATAGR